MEEKILSANGGGCSDIAVSFTWIESDTKLIANPQMVKLHSFDTKIHKVHTHVSWNDTTFMLVITASSRENLHCCVLFSGVPVVSSSLGLAGVGAVIRDFVGRVLVSSVAKLSGVTSPLLAEAWAILKGLLFACDTGIRLVTLNFDAQAVVHLINTNARPL
ncbi:hypothetical protein Ddye_025480 [Dipteronia dyeriana]|uniref:RNase H type-1 domain-containing protein n=1 Tax=Dipteronia dyeriana TaxID=168575 RepID=A0AAD9TKA6_9ROSI|nr:hypothetical protein Ddye_025480 [Dipteronia dyeriana]